MSKAWAEQHGVTKPADYIGAREETYASRHANGTGPFMLQSFEPRGGWVLVRNPDWWGTADYPHNIDRVVHIPKEGDAENVAALLEGEIDLLQTPPYWALDQIRRTPGLKLAYRTKLHTIFFGLDQGSAELRSSNVKGRNPFKDKRVRQAMAHAIDIEPILHDLMGELFIPAGMIVAPGVNGYAPELDQPPPYDPEKARALLAEAGYPDGFSVTLDCPNDWGDDEIAACKGVAEQLGAIGIEVAINFLSTDEYEAKVYNARAERLPSRRLAHGSGFRAGAEGLFHSQSEWNVIRLCQSAGRRADREDRRRNGDLCAGRLSRGGLAHRDRRSRLPADPPRGLGVRHAQESGDPARPLGRAALPPRAVQVGTAGAHLHRPLWLWDRHRTSAMGAA